MSITTAAGAWIPPAFPAQGRVHKTSEQWLDNLARQYREETDYTAAARQAAGVCLPAPCCKTLHLSFFFDGTNNNEKAATAANPPNPSNIARNSLTTQTNGGV